MSYQSCHAVRMKIKKSIRCGRMTGDRSPRFELPQSTIFDICSGQMAKPQKRLPAKKMPTVAALHDEDVVPYHTNGNGYGKAKLKFIDLFCGIGGFRYAFERAGAECVFSSDWNEKAQETYAANHGERPHGDIHTVLDKIPDHEILCAGFPCQPFSIAGVSKKLSLGKKHGFEDLEQGNLFFTLADIIKDHQPDAFVLENVKNLKSHDKGNTFRVIYETLTDILGYTVYHRSLTRKASCPSTANASFSLASGSRAILNSRHSRRKGRNSNPFSKRMSRTNTP